MSKGAYPLAYYFEELRKKAEENKIQSLSGLRHDRGIVKAAIKAKEQGGI